MQLSLARQRVLTVPWAAEGLALIGGIAYLVQSWIYAHTQDSILDEGAYLVKGILFVTGKYVIYQDYGPWSNHMPLAFYIPGAVQAIFGPGLQTARYFALLVGMLMLAGLWLLARRLKGRWWAAAAVLLVAWNPAMVRVYSVAVTQGLVACFFVWMLVFTLDGKRPQWQIVSGSVLSGLMMLTRINLTPVLPLLVLYIFWQYGSKAGWIAALASGTVVLVGHALFWPGILRMWAYWLPESLTPFLEAWRPPTGVVGFWDPNISISSRLASFFHSFRFQFIAMVGALSTWLLWPSRTSWRNRNDFRSAIFLSSLFASLWLGHLWATMGKDYCVFCLAGYMTFFASAGILLVILTLTLWRTQLSWPRQIFVALTILIVSTGIGFGAFEDVGGSLAEMSISRLFLGEPQRYAESVPLGAVLENKFHLGYQVIRRLTPAAFGFAAGMAMLIAAVALWAIFVRRNDYVKPSPGYLAVLIFFLAGAVFTPSIVLGGGYHTYDCDADVIGSYQVIGHHLAEKIPPGSRVYWRGRLSAAPLVYMPGIEIYPAQLNGDYTYHIGGDPDALARYGFWNEELARRWADEADFILIARHYYAGWLKELVNAGGFDELERTPVAAHCTEEAQIRIFRRKVNPVSSIIDP
jgi:hypothetical protein